MTRYNFTYSPFSNTKINKNAWLKSVLIWLTAPKARKATGLRSGAHRDQSCDLNQSLNRLPTIKRCIPHQLMGLGAKENLGRLPEQACVRGKTVCPQLCDLTMESRGCSAGGEEKVSPRAAKIVARLSLGLSSVPSVLIIALCTEVKYIKSCNFVHTSPQGRLKLCSKMTTHCDKACVPSSEPAQNSNAAPIAAISGLPFDCPAHVLK